MMLPPRLARRGFTLIELLVVIAIIGSLLGLTSLSFRPSRGSEIRQAAQSLASLLLTTQSRALGNEAGAALWILSSGSPPGIYDADVRADLIGDVTEVVNASASGTATIKSTLSPSDLGDVFRARLLANASNSAAPSSWFEPAPGNPLELRFSGSQTPNNTIWPPRFYTHKAVPQCRVQYSTRPAKSGILYAWPKLAKLDLRWSGFGTQTAAGSAVDIGIVFDRFGRPERVFSVATNGIVSDEPMDGPFFLLIAFSPDVNDSSAATTKPLTNDDSIWVALHPETGRITVSWNNPSTDLTQARQNSRAGLGLAR